MKALVGGMNLALCVAHRLQAYFAYFQRLPRSLTTDNFRAALVALYALVLRFLAQAVQVYTSNTASRKLQAVWQESDVATFESRCDKLAARADIEANNCDRDLRAKRLDGSRGWIDELKRALQDLDAIQTIQNSLDSLKIQFDLSKLSTVQQAIYNSSAEAKLSQCLEGTRSDVMDGIAQWARDPNSKLMFWLCGKAGTGKSTIARTFAARLDMEGQLAASFFFKRGESKRSNADYFFSTITAQLADRFPQMKGPIAAALEKDSFLCGRGIREQYEKLLLQPLLHVEPACVPHQNLVIVIDALDECDRETDIRIFLKLLAQVEVKSALRLRIFITSRPELPIRLGFRKLDGSLHQDVVLEQVQEQSIQQDIRTYFIVEFAKIKEDRFDDARLDEWPSKIDLEILVDLAVPLFIFASTVCRFVSESKPRKRLQLILEQRYMIGSSHLAKTYLPILDQLLAGKEPDERQEVLEDFRGIVGPIVLAANPLSVTTLASLLVTARYDINDIKGMFNNPHSVLQVPPSANEPVKILHLSFRDFLIDHKRVDKEGFWIDETETHKTLLRCCLRRLEEAWASKDIICSNARPGTRRIAVSAEQLSDDIPPHIAYACSFWPEHLVASGQPICDDGQVHRFLQRHFLHWLEALSWLGKTYKALAYTDDLLRSAERDGGVQVSMFLTDASRFVRMHRQVLDLAPLQIYHSAMIFTPLYSMVRKTFEGQTPKLWEHLPKIPARWSAELSKLEGHDNAVNAVAFSPDGRTVASASTDCTVRLWNTQTDEQMQKLEGHDDEINAVAFSPDGQVVISASWDRKMQLWDTATGEPMRKLEGHDDSINDVAFSPDGRWIASASDDLTIRLWNAATGVETQRIETHAGSVSSIAFSPDNQILASASEDKTVRLWSMQTYQPVLVLEGHNTAVSAIVFSRDGQMLASASGDRTVRLWNVQTGKQIRKLEGFVGGSGAVAISPDGRGIVSAAAHGIIQLWDLRTGELRYQVRGHGGSVYAIAFSPDGRVIASAWFDGKVRLWHAYTGKELQVLEGHEYKASAVAFSPDGRVIASAAEDKTVRLWDAQTGEQLRLISNTNFTRQLEFSADGTSLQTRSQTLRLADTILQTREPGPGQTTTLERNDQWVRCGDQDVLWLPHEYRGLCSVVVGSTIVIGQASGDVSFIKLR